MYTNDSLQEPVYDAENSVDALQSTNESDKFVLLSKVLRRIGALILLTSAASFILQGWTDWDSFTRYFVFLSFTSILAAAGIFCGLRLGEDKGARTLLAVATAIVPAHFLQLGAFIYSGILIDKANIPGMFLYQAPSMLAALATVLLACAFIVPISYLGFSALARVKARELTACYLLANAMLLLPVRGASLIAGIATILFIVLARASFYNFSRERAMKNLDGRLAQSMLFVPFFLLLARSSVVYSIDGLLTSVLCAALAFFAFAIARMSSTEARRNFLEVLGVSLTASSWWNFSTSVFFGSSGLLQSLGVLKTSSYEIPLIILPITLLLIMVSFFTVSFSRGLRQLGTQLALVAALTQLVLIGGISASLLCIILGLSAIVTAFSLEDRVLFYSGVLSLGAGLLYHLKSAALLYSMSPWLSLAVLGLAVVVGASYLERHSRLLLAEVSRFQARLREWK